MTRSKLDPAMSVLAARSAERFRAESECTCLKCCYARKHPQLGPTPHAVEPAEVTAESLTNAQIQAALTALPRGHYSTQWYIDAMGPESSSHPNRRRNARRYVAGAINAINARAEKQLYSDPKEQHAHEDNNLALEAQRIANERGARAGKP